MSEEECVLDEQGVESFESLYEKLMVVVERLEVGGLSLEESIGLMRKERDSTLHVNHS